MPQMMVRGAQALLVFLLWGWVTPAALGADVPRYKPSSRSPQPLDITRNDYGFSRTAPAALEIGDLAPGFVLPRAGGGSVSLQQMRTVGPTVLIFYRGHW